MDDNATFVRKDFDCQKLVTISIFQKLHPCQTFAVVCILVTDNSVTGKKHMTYYINLEKSHSNFRYSIRSFWTPMSPHAQTCGVQERHKGLQKHGSLVLLLR